MMTYQKYFYTLLSLYLCSTFYAISADEVICDKSKCKGPLKYYEDMQCTPIYSNEDTCCPMKYNCDHLKDRSKDKCYYLGHVYELHEHLSAEDATPCDVNCTCEKGTHNFARFKCAEFIDCPLPMEDCYLKRSHNQCCGGETVCPKIDTRIAQCEVDGKTYLDGQEFTPSSDPTQYCICGKGYTGANVSPFCKPVKPHVCRVHLNVDIHNKCIPEYNDYQNPATDCTGFTACPQQDDSIAESTAVTSVSDPSSTCIFGELTMKIGDELNPKSIPNYSYRKCVCEVPPIPTCQWIRYSTKVV